MARKFSWKKFFSNVGKGILTGGSTGALTGATAGLASGGTLSGPGAVAGGVLGGIGGGVKGAFDDAYEDEGGQSANPANLSPDDLAGLQKWLFDTPEGQQFYSRFSPEQQKYMMDLLKNGQNDVMNPTQGFAPIRANAIRSFEEQGVPSLIHRLSTGGDNALSSPILHAQLSSGRAQLDSNLAEQEARYAQTNKKLGLAQQELGLQPMYDRGGQNINIGGQPQSRYQDLLGGGIDLAVDAWNNYKSKQANAQGNTNQQSNSVQPISVRQAVSPYTTQPFLQKNYESYGQQPSSINSKLVKQAVSPQFTVPALQQRSF